MNWWKWDRSWILVWGSSLIVGGLILCIGYQSFLVESVREKAQTTKSVQAVSAEIPVSVSEKPRDGKIVEISTQTGERMTVNSAQLNVSKINDFPSPVQGKLLRNVGNYYSEVLDSYLFHGGVDYAEPEGTIIRVTHGGRIVFAGRDPLLGQKVTLDCGGGWLVTYGGLDNLCVNSGDTIGISEKIGQVGLFPGAEGPRARTQLHYEVWHGDDVQRLDLQELNNTTFTN